MKAKNKNFKKGFMEQPGSEVGFFGAKTYSVQEINLKQSDWGKKI